MRRRTTSTKLANLAVNWPEIASVESDVVLGLIRLNGLVRTGLETLLKDNAITPAAFDVLVTLRSLPPPRRLTPTELYDATLISSGGLTKVLAGLVQRGLVVLQANSDDGRSKTVSLTAKGKRFIERLAAQVAEQDRRLFSGALDEPRIADLRAVLLETISALEDTERKPE